MWQSVHTSHNHSNHGVNLLWLIIVVVLDCTVGVLGGGAGAQRQYKGRSRLPDAISRDMTALASAMIAKGADCRATDGEGYHAFARAVERRNVELVRYE